MEKWHERDQARVEKIWTIQIQLWVEKWDASEEMSQFSAISG